MIHTQYFYLDLATGQKKEKSYKNSFRKINGILFFKTAAAYAYHFFLFIFFSFYLFIE